MLEHLAVMMYILGVWGALFVIVGFVGMYIDRKYPGFVDGILVRFFGVDTDKEK